MMRIAILSDIHGNRTAFEAVLGDLQQTAPDLADAELESIYEPLRRPIAVYGHIHRPYIRSFPSPHFRARLIANTGSVGLPYDGDRRASYLLLDESSPTIRRVEYDLETLHAASPQMP